jgi:catechol 2,3-dioxygenase-like lactoylglutathione lyase family enzyme
MRYHAAFPRYAPCECQWVELVAALDHIILKVNDLNASVSFYNEVMGFSLEGMDGPFTVLRAGPDFQLQLAPWGTAGLEHYAFCVSKREFQDIFARIKSRGIAFGPTFDSVGVNTSPGQESGARGMAPTLYFNDPNKHLIEIRTYER